jgi:site-specific recombinase XerD
MVNRRPEEDVVEPLPPLDSAGRRRSPATTANFHLGRPPHNKGMRYPGDPPTIEEIVAVMRAASDGVRRRAVIIILWRAGLRISEALALNETDLDHDRGAVLVRHGKGDKRREFGMDRWAWSHLEPWLDLRRELPIGWPLSPAGIRAQLHRVALAAGVRRQVAPHQLRHAHAVEMSREGISLIVIQRQLGHADLEITSRYLRGIDNTEIIQPIYQRPEPVIPAGHQLIPPR